jgi:hypothetical protein
MSKKELHLTFVEHRSAKSLVVGYFRPEYPRLSVKRILEQKTEFSVLLGETIPNARVSELLKAVQNRGMWGWCKHLDKNNKEIHYWLDKPPLNQIKVFELFAHEISHAFGYSCEKRAQKIAAVSAFTFAHFMEKIVQKCN